MSITHEYVNNDWFDETAIRLPNYRVGRVNFGAGRSYIKLLEDGSLAQPFRLYTSLTTAISASMPTPKTLEDWKFEHGKKESERLTKVAAHYGTLMHLQIGKFCIEKVYDLDGTEQAVEDYTSENNFWDEDCKGWSLKLKQDMLAFMQFFFDYEVIPQGLEYVLLSERGFGTMIDLVCMLTISEDGLDYENTYKSGPRKGEPRQVKVRVKKRAIINFKSGRKGFYETHGIQIECEKQLWEENFPDMPIDMACNWAPTDWISTPGYKLKQWDDVVSKEEVSAILALAEIRYRSRAEKRQYMNMSGVIASQEALLQAIQYEDVEEYCIRKFGNTPAISKVKRTTRKKAVAKKEDPAPAPKPTPAQVHFISNPLPI